MRVGVNLLWLVPGVVGGSEESTVRLLHGLADLGAPDVEVELFALDRLGQVHPDLVARFPTHTFGLKGWAKPLRVAAETTWLPWAMRRRGIDVAHHAGGVVPLASVRPAILTVHDLQPLDLPENFGRTKVAYLRAMLPRAARSAAVVMVPSRASGDRMTEVLGVDPDRIRIVPHGLEPELFAPVPEAAIDRVRRHWALRGRWILYPVITYPHKDHETLIRAFTDLAGRHPDVDLVLSGGEGPAEEEVRALAASSGVADRIRRTGRIPRDDLDALFTGASAVAFPSRYEGFGIGALEAMARGTPVVAADAMSLPEVVGQAGTLVPVGDVAAWSRALAAVLDDPDRARRQVEAGRVRARSFTNLAAAATLLDIYRELADPGDQA